MRKAAAVGHLVGLAAAILLVAAPGEAGVAPIALDLITIEGRTPEFRIPAPLSFVVVSPRRLEAPPLQAARLLAEQLVSGEATPLLTRLAKLGRETKPLLAGEGKGGLTFQQADLLLEQAHLQGSLADTVWMNSLDLLRKRQPDSSRTPFVAIDPRENLAPAIAALEAIVKRCPGYPHRTEVLFLLAEWLGREGRGSEAVLALEEMIRLAPEGPLAPDGWKRLGDFHLQVGEWEAATTAYRQVLLQANRAERLQAVVRLRLAAVEREQFQMASAVAGYLEVVGQSQQPDGGAHLSFGEEAADAAADLLLDADWDSDGLDDWASADAAAARILTALPEGKPESELVLLRVAEKLELQVGVATDDAHLRQELLLKLINEHLRRYPDSPRAPAMRQGADTLTGLLAASPRGENAGDGLDEELEGAFSADSNPLRSGLLRRKGMLRRCYDAHRRRHPVERGGRVVIEAILGPAGKATVALTEKQVGDPLAACLLHVAGEISFPRLQKGQLQFSTPLLFRPPE